MTKRLTDFLSQNCEEMDIALTQWPEFCVLNQYIILSVCGRNTKIAILPLEKVETMDLLANSLKVLLFERINYSHN